jgi:hypothetical protein
MELSNVRKIICREAEYFKNPIISDELKKRRMNLLFMRDLLDGVNGMILDHKDRRDNEKKNSVEKWHKVVTTIFLFLVSLGMLFYIYLFAMRQSKNRQQAWFNSFVVWLFFEICISSTGIVLLEHVLIPLWSMKDVQHVKEKIVSDILIYQRRLQYAKNRNQLTETGTGSGRHGLVGLRSVDEGMTPNDGSSFNAAEYLYPSFRIAQLFPSFPESQLILQYKTPWPKRSLQHQDKSVKTKYDKRFDFLTQTLSRVVVFTLTSMIQLPQPLQDSSLQIFLIGFFGFVIRLHIRLYEINHLLVILPLFVIGICVHLLTISSNQKSRILAQRTHPTDASDQLNGDLTPVSPPDSRVLPQPNVPAVSASSAAEIPDEHPDVEDSADYADGDCIWESEEDEDDLYELDNESSNLNRSRSTHSSSSQSSGRSFQSSLESSHEDSLPRVVIWEDDEEEELVIPHLLPSP